MELKVCVSAAFEKPDAQRNGASTHKVLARKGQQVQDVFFVLKEKGGDLDDYSNFAQHLREILKGQDCTVTVSARKKWNSDDSNEDSNDDVISTVARNREYDRKGTREVLQKLEWW